MRFISPVKIWRKQKQIYQLLGQKGRIISWTKIHTPPVGFADEAPYFVVLARMTDGTVKVGQLVNWQNKPPQKGLKVELVYRRLGKVNEEDLINYGLKFQPVIKDGPLSI